MFIIHSIEKGKLTVRWQYGAHGTVDMDVTQHEDDTMAKAHARELFKQYAIRQTERILKASKKAHREESKEWTDPQRFAASRLDAFVNHSLSKTESFFDWLQFIIKLEPYYMRILPPKSSLWRKDIESVILRLLEDTITQIVDWQKTEKQHQQAS